MKRELVFKEDGQGKNGMDEKSDDRLDLLMLSPSSVWAIPHPDYQHQYNRPCTEYDGEDQL